MPGCIKWPMATFVNYIHTMKLHSNFGGYVYHVWFWHMWLVNQPTITVQALCQKRVNTHYLCILYDSNNTVRLFPFAELTGFCNGERVYLLCSTNKSSNKIQVKFHLPRVRQTVTNTVMFSPFVCIWSEHWWGRVLVQPQCHLWWHPSLVQGCILSQPYKFLLYQPCKMCCRTYHDT